jgi:anaerobic magnesium-protoporphyrin IX monomethyl ester cyclase
MKNKAVKKVLLVQPNMKWIDWNWKTCWDLHPLNLCLLAATARDEFEIEILDSNLKDHTQEQFQKIVRDLKPDLVGLTLLTNEYSEVAHIAARLLKEVNPEIITVLGGVYATVSYTTIFNDSNFDYICVGEGEWTFPQLLRYLNGSSEFPREGFLGRKQGELTDPNKVVRALIENLDELPLPAWDMVDYSLYTCRTGRLSIDQPRSFPYARLMVSRGCPVGCTFCEVEVISGGPFRYRSADNVIMELDFLKKNYGIKSFMLDDDNFFVNRKRARDVLRKMLEKDLKMEWKALAVPVFHIDEEIIDLMKASGCNSIALALESGSERILKDIIRKPVRLDHVRKICKKIKDEGMDLVANWIVGFPTETWAEIRQTFAFAEELKTDYSKFFIATPLEGTILHDMVVENNLMADGTDTSGRMQDLNWSTGKILSDEWTVDDLTILRAYEWERINFAPEKREKLSRMLGVSLEELDKLRQNTFSSVVDNILKNNKSKAVDTTSSHAADHRLCNAESYPGVEVGREESVMFGY